jgi:F0F1-type ATP synthase membrane subunit c/vacuolar-type H+-ATPase subunit K
MADMYENPMLKAELIGGGLATFGLGDTHIFAAYIQGTSRNPALRAVIQYHLY